jgi:hypothetical protein
MKNIYNPVYFVFIVFYLILSENAFTQSKTFYNLFSQSDNSAILNSSEIQKYLNDAVLLNVNKSELRDICENKYPEISLSIPYKGSSAILNLKRFDILSPDAKLVSRTAAGNEKISWSDVTVSYTGNLDGSDKQLVIMNFSNSNVTGLLSTEYENYILGSLKDVNGNYTDDHILYK